jgi:ParB/RepB/Spo0J family partition protein
VGYKEGMEKQTVDLHMFELRYAHIRVQNAALIRRLADSISRHGQLEAMLAVSGKEDRLILIDGYQRQAALRYLGRDTALVLVGDLSEDQALFQLLIQRGKRRWEVIEEAGLIQELHRRFDCSFSEIGRRMGRDKSYVKRRLDLLESLPDEVLRQVLSGIISTWAASRVLVPLARANPADAATLATHLEHEPLSTRQLRLFYEHYQKANRQVRERMLKSPTLFIRSSQTVGGEDEKCPEEKWLRDAGAVCGILHRLQDQTDTVFYPNQGKRLRRQLLVRAAKARRLTLELQQKIKERIQDDRANQGAADQGAEQTRCESTDHYTAAGGLPQHGEQDTPGNGHQSNPREGVKV